MIPREGMPGEVETDPGYDNRHDADAPADAPPSSAVASLGGSGRADERLVQALSLHFRVVWRSLRRFGVPEAQVDDAVQHVFATLSRKLDTVGVGKERAFLLATAARVAANVRRAEQRERAPRDDEQDIDSLEHPDPVPEELLEWKRRRELLEGLLDALPHDQRTAFVLFELEGLSMTEISEALEIPMGTVASRLRRARARFETGAQAIRKEHDGVRR
jgi:RNA polymerase sigma-70 factor (ECF subfamily)